MSLKNPAARYRLAHGTEKTQCPKCGRKRFRRYMDTTTGELLPEEVGVCDRENNCGYLFTAMDHIRAKGGFGQIERRVLPPPEPVRDDWRVPAGKWEKTRTHHNNSLIQWMLSNLGDNIKGVIEEYRVGTFPKIKGSERWENATVFWQFNAKGELLNGKMMQYKGFRRDKDVTPTWISRIITGKSGKEIGSVQCLFGEHLLAKYPDAKVALVESEKTALVGRYFYPDIVWVATGGSDALNGRKMMALSGRKVYMFPDAGVGYVAWNKAADQYEPLFASLHVSSYVEAAANDAERESGIDIADLLIEGHAIDSEFADTIADTVSDNVVIYAHDLPPGVPVAHPDMFKPTITEFTPEVYTPQSYVVGIPQKVGDNCGVSRQDCGIDVGIPAVEKLLKINPAIKGMIEVLDLDTKNITISTCEEQGSIRDSVKGGDVDPGGGMADRAVHPGQEGQARNRVPDGGTEGGGPVH